METTRTPARRTTPFSACWRSGALRLRPFPVAAESIQYMWAPSRSQIYKVLPRLVGWGLATGRPVAQERRPTSSSTGSPTRASPARRLGRAGRGRPRGRPRGLPAQDLLRLDRGARQAAAAQLRAYRALLERRLQQYEAIEAGSRARRAAALADRPAPRDRPGPGHAGLGGGVRARPARSADAVRRAALLLGVVLAAGCGGGGGTARPRREGAGDAARRVPHPRRPGPRRDAAPGGRLTAVGAILGHAKQGRRPREPERPQPVRVAPAGPQLTAKGSRRWCSTTRARTRRPTSPRPSGPCAPAARPRSGWSGRRSAPARSSSPAALRASTRRPWSASRPRTTRAPGRPRIVPFVRRLRAPVLLVSSRQDPYTAEARDTREQYRASGSRQTRAALEPGDAHGVDLLAGARGRRLTATVLAFLQPPEPPGIPHSG